MALSGTLSTMALPDLLQWLAGSAKSGTLRITNGRFRKEILFRDGVIASTSSDDPREFLGQFLLSNHRITEEQLRKAMETQRATGVMLGKILVMVKAIEEDELRRMLTLKAQETLFSLFLWKEGSFELDETVPVPESLFPISLNVEDVLLEGLRRYDELQVILQAFSSGEFVLRRTGAPVPPKLKDSPVVRRLLEVVDGRRTLTDLCLELHASEFKISRLAYELYRRGCLEVLKEPEPASGAGPATESPLLLVARADTLLQAQKFEEALDVLGRAVEMRPSDLTLRGRLDAAEAAFLERAYTHYLPPGHVPVLRRPLEQLTGETLTPEEVFLVSRINGSWTVKDIITISPLREVEAVRLLKSLRERAILEIRPAG